MPGLRSAARFQRSLIEGIRLWRIAVPAELRSAIHNRLMSETLCQDGGPALPVGGM